MNDTISSKSDNKKEEDSHIRLSSENNEINYKYNDTNCTLRTLEHISSLEEEKEMISVCANSQNIEEKSTFIDGKIEVTSILDCGEHEYLQGVKINLYKINGLSPVLIKSKTTNEEGKVVFSEIQEGCYRVIEIVDKRFFEKPKYINWNEIIIDSINQNQKIVIVNRIKKSELQSKHKFI